MSSHLDLLIFLGELSGHDYRLEMGAEVGLGANLSEIPGSPPPLTLTSGSSRASALSEGPPFLPCDTLEELFFVEPVSAVNLRPSPKSRSNFSAQQGMCQELTEMFVCTHQYYAQTASATVITWSSPFGTDGEESGSKSSKDFARVG